MNTVQSVKQRLIDHLAQMDLNKLPMTDLCGYTGIVHQLAMMEKPDYTEALARMALNGGMGVRKTNEFEEVC